MEHSGGLFPIRTALTELDRILDRIDPDRSGLDAQERLECLRLARKVTGRMNALTAVLVTEAETTQASMKAVGTPLTSWLGMDGTVSRREAAGIVHQAKDVAARAQVGAAATSGRIGIGQAKAINRVLDDLSAQLDSGQQAQAEQLMLDLAGQLDADQLSKAAGRVLRQVAPQTADDLLETRLQREAEAAYRQRSLRFWRDGGSIRFDGSLPRIEGEAWLAQINAVQQRQRRNAIEERDPLAVSLTPEQRRADALIDWIQATEANRAKEASSLATVFVTLDYAKLSAGAADAGLLGEGQPLSAGELRRICCDAELIPAVLGGSSAVLDVGRASRLVTPEIRTALILRDAGCVFPGCDVAPGSCEAHHVLPWWQGGKTALTNLVLLCHRHHALIEPARQTVRDQWQVRLARDGLPEFVPPARIDAERRPIRHRRHRAPAQTSRPTQRAGPPAA